MKLFRTGITLLLILLTTFSASGEEKESENGVISDEFARYYETRLGFQFSIADMPIGKEEETQKLRQEISEPLAEIELDDYILRVTEVLSLRDEIYATVELEMKRDGVILRPWDVMLPASPYYAPPEEYELPVYYLLMQVDGVAETPAAGSLFGIGLSDDGKRMSDIESWLRPEYSTKLPADASAQEVKIKVTVYKGENGVTTEEKVYINLWVPLDCWLAYTV